MHDTKIKNVSLGGNIMKINGITSSYPEATFLGGTCADSTWRSKLIPMLCKNVSFFDPQLGPGEWNDEAAAAEDACKDVCRILVFVLTADSLSAYSGFEIGTLCTQNAQRVIFCAYGDFPENQVKGISKIARDVAKMGGTVCNSLEEIAKLLNSAY